MENNAVSVCLVSLGCDKNLVDSEVMLGLIRRAGYGIAAQEGQADVIVVNTCGFIKDAVQEGIDTILSLAAHKSGRCRLLIVAGCMAQRYREEILHDMPEVDVVIGVNDFPYIADIISEALGSRAEASQTCGPFSQIPPKESIYGSRYLSAPLHTASVKIADGCDNRCAYCAIPSIRGAYRSRTVENVVEECRLLADHGVREITLVAQDTARYGVDIYGGPRLHDLIVEISRISGVGWIRLLYAYPEHLTPEIIRVIATQEKVCKYLDIPIQHSHDAVLKRMGRPGSSNGVLRALVLRLREEVQGIALRTTVMVGFPGETDEEFENLLAFIKDMRFDKLGVFKYSKEDGTPAARMPNQVKASEKRNRFDAAMRMQQSISREIQESLVGKTLRVMVDGQMTEKALYCGRSYRDAYDMDGSVFFPSEVDLISGDIVTIKITQAQDYDLMGIVAN